MKGSVGKGVFTEKVVAEVTRMFAAFQRGVCFGE